MKIEYDGGYPNLCRGTLVVIINGKRWKFSDYCLSSGGCIIFDKDWVEHVGHGPWSIYEWPKNFPKKYKEEVLQEINEQIPWGCCGGCV